jgi:hypothetical protein
LPAWTSQGSYKKQISGRDTVFARKGILKLWLTALAAVLIFQALPFRALGDEDPYIYGTYGALSMGNPGETNQRDFYLTLGANQGVKVGAKVEVLRKIPTHNLLSKSLQKDMIFPIAMLRVIHVEQTAAIARVEKVYPEDATPAITPRAVMVGDVIRLTR